QASDLGNGVALAGDERPIAEHAVDPFETLLGVLPAHLTVLRHLGNAALEEGVAVPEDLRDRQEDLVLHPALPHLDQGAILRIGAQEPWLRLPLLQAPPTPPPPAHP